MTPDLERLAVAWAKADGPIAAVVSDRVATRLPAKWSGNFLRVVTVAGTMEVAETSDIATGVLQFDAFAKSSGASPNYADASLLARTTIASLFTVGDVTIADEGQIVCFGIPTLARRIEEPETGWARFMFECSLTGRATA
jgi:hypothetical protein